RTPGEPATVTALSTGFRCGWSSREPMISSRSARAAWSLLNSLRALTCLPSLARYTRDDTPLSSSLSSWSPSPTTVPMMRTSRHASATRHRLSAKHPTPPTGELERGSWLTAIVSALDEDGGPYQRREGAALDVVGRVAGQRAGNGSVALTRSLFDG